MLSKEELNSRIVEIKHLLKKIQIVSVEFEPMRKALKRFKAGDHSSVRLYVKCDDPFAQFPIYSGDTDILKSAEDLYNSLHMALQDAEQATDEFLQTMEKHRAVLESHVEF